MKTLTGYAITCPCCKDEREVTRFGIKGLEKEYAVYSAAPELLEACKFILSQLDPNNDHPKTQCVLNSDCLSPKDTDDQSVVEYLKAAISKAEGNA